MQSIALDRRRPLWEMWVIDGLEDDDVGLIIKTHHALGDGIANVDLALAIVDLAADPPDDGEPPCVDTASRTVRSATARGLRRRPDELGR